MPKHYKLEPDLSTPESTAVVDRVLNYIASHSVGLDRLRINEIYDIKIKSGAFVLVPDRTAQWEKSVKALKAATLKIEQAYRNRHETPDYEDTARQE